MLATKGEIDNEEGRLLKGILQPPPKNMKRFDRMTREEYLKKQRNKLGKNYSDEYDDEDYSDELGSDWEDDTTR